MSPKTTRKRVSARLALTLVLALTGACQRTASSTQPTTAAISAPSTQPATPAAPSDPAPVQPAAAPAPTPAPVPSAAAPGAAPTVALRASCDYTGASYCTDYTARSIEGRAPMGVTEDTLRSGCGTSSGTWAATPCPTANVLGTCTSPEGDLIRYYSTGPRHYNAARASEHCANPVGGFAGTWAAAP